MTLAGRMRREIAFEVKGVDSQMTGRTSMISFTIGYGGRDPETVARVTNELARMFVQENTTLRAGQASNTAEFLKTQLDDARKELDVYDRRQNDFKLSHIGELPQQVDANLASLERLNTQLRLNGENQLRLLDRRDRLERQRFDAAAAPRPGAKSPEAERLAKLTQQLADLRKQFTDAYPDVDAASRRNRRADAGDRATAAGAQCCAPTATPSAAQAAARSPTWRPSSGRSRRRNTRSGRPSRSTRSASRTCRSASRSCRICRATTATTKERYDSLAKRYEEAQLAASLEQGRKAEQFRILDPAIPPRDPVAPVRARLLGLGWSLALGPGDRGGGRGGEARHHVSQRRRAARQRQSADPGERAAHYLARRDAPQAPPGGARGAVGRRRHVAARGRITIRVLRQRAAGSDDGAIPRLMETLAHAPAHGGGSPPVTIDQANSQGGMAEQLVSFLAPDSPAADRYRALRYALESHRSESGRPVVAITSPTAGDGKTVTVLNLAGAFAQAEGARVLVVDADLRKPSVANYLGLDQRSIARTEPRAAEGRLRARRHRPAGRGVQFVGGARGPAGAVALRALELVAAGHADS